MTKTYEIYDTASGVVTGIQTWDDQQAPVLKYGEAARPVPGNIIASGSFTGPGPGDAVLMFGAFNVSISGTFVGGVTLQRSFDGGDTFIRCTFPGGARVEYWAPMAGAWNEIERGVLYRLNCDSYTSGQIDWRISR